MIEEEGPLNISIGRFIDDNFTTIIQSTSVVVGQFISAEGVFVTFKLSRS